MKHILLPAILFTFLPVNASAVDKTPIRILFFGDNGHHRPADRFRQLQPVLKKRGIELTYTNKRADFNTKAPTRCPVGPLTNATRFQYSFG